MDAKQALKEILEAAKPLTVTEASRGALVRDCVKSGINVDNNLNIWGVVTEKHIDGLLNDLSNSVLKMVVRRIMRKFLQ